MVVEKFQIYSVKITANRFVSQTNESLQFYSYPQAKLSPRFLSLSFSQTGIAHSSWTAFFKYIFYWGHRRERIMELKIIPTLTKVSVTNSTIPGTFTVLVYVLLCNNSASSMLKCKASLTWLIKLSLKCMMCRNTYMKFATLPCPIF